MSIIEVKSESITLAKIFYAYEFQLKINAANQFGRAYCKTVQTPIVAGKRQTHREQRSYDSLPEAVKAGFICCRRNKKLVTI